MIDDMHKKLSTWLCDNYRVILIPEFKVQGMIDKKKRKICSKTAREMCTWAHFRFRQRLIQKAELYPWCKVIVCDEHYTSKTCGACGVLHPTRHFIVPRVTNYIADRDISAARNILLRYLTRENIKWRG